MPTVDHAHCAPHVTPGRVLVIIPTYNEIDSLPHILRRVRLANPAVDVLVVDDNSPDGTGRLADDIAARDPQINVLHRTAKDGLGAAYLAGFAWGLEAEYDVLVEMDADGSHQPEQLRCLLGRVSNGAEFVAGSRWVEGGAVENWPLHRKLLSRGGSWYTRIALGLDVRDITGGYRAITADALRRMDLASVESAGYCFQIDLAWRAVKHGIEVVEVPITFVERERGESKMSSGIVVEALLRVTGWALRYRLGGRRQQQALEATA